MKIIKAENIKNEEIIKVILDNLIPVNEYLDQINENSSVYEDICFDVQMQFCEIYEALDIAKMKLTNKNLAIADIMNFKMWDYLRGEVEFEDLILYLKKEYERKE